MNPKALLKNPKLIHNVPEVDLELVSREVVELAVAKSKSKGSTSTKQMKHATRLMFFIGEVYHRSPLFSCSLVCAYAKMDGNVNAIIKAATLNRNDPGMRGFLDYLRTHLAPGYGPFPTGKPLIVRPAEERACMWAGWNTKQTRASVQHLRR